MANSTVSKIKQRIWREQWNIAIAKRGKRAVLDEGIGHEDMQWLFPERKQGFYADPFLIEVGNKAWLFYEEYDYPSDKGVISVSEVTYDGKKYNATKPQTVLEESFHLSYPTVFRQKGKWMMLPETAAAGHQYVYEAIEFPFKWKRYDKMIENVDLLDPTMFEHKGLKWVFCSRLSKGENSRLYAYFWNREKKLWQEHNGNPIVVGLGNSRPAGSIFKVGSRLFRPAQNSQGTYGKSIVINEILKLSPDNYEEVKRREICAERCCKYGQGTHTINFAGEFLVIDGKRFHGFKKAIDPLYNKFFKMQ